MTNNQSLGAGDAAQADNTPQKEKFWHTGLRLPVIALALDLSGGLYFGLAALCIALFNGGPFMTLFFILTFLSPVAGVILGIASLSLGKKNIGKSGFGISVAAAVLPLALIPLLFIGTMAALLSGM